MYGFYNDSWARHSNYPSEVRASDSERCRVYSPFSALMLGINYISWLSSFLRLIMLILKDLNSLFLETAWANILAPLDEI